MEKIFKKAEVDFFLKDSQELQEALEKKKFRMESH
jgi:hypothetical protein